MEDMVGFNQRLKNCFAGKKVLVTGHTGFKGSWLILWLKMLGAQVIGVALEPRQPFDHFYLLGLQKQIEHHVIDIRNYESLMPIIEKFQPEFVFHLAAQPLVGESYQDPKYTFDVNIGGTVNILEAARQIASIKVLVCITSDKCYVNKEWVWGYRENDELGGKDPYSASKAATELVFHSYLQSFFYSRSDLGAASVRAGNVIGGGDWSPNRIVPDCIRSLISNKPITIRHPNSTRPWQHVLEPLSGYLRLATFLYEDPKRYSGSWNFGPRGGAMSTVQDLAEKIIQVWGRGTIEHVQSDSGVEAQLLHLCCDKAENLLGWHARWDFDRTIIKVVQWYQGIQQGEDAWELSVRQIAEYMDYSEAYI